MMIRVLAVLLLFAGCNGDAGRVDALRLTVMSFNTWGAGSNDGTTIDATVAAIRAAKPDVIALLETRAESVPCTSTCPPVGPSRAPDIAKALGYFVYEQAKQNELLWANAILSRYPIVRATEHDLGVVIDVSGRKVAVFGIHPTDYPYQPYQLLGIAYDGAPFLESESDAIAAANAARQPGMDLLFGDLATVADTAVAIIAGDFNEPSHRDWTERAAEIGRHPLRVRYPTTMRLEAAGFVDTYRALYPDEVDKPGFTWTPTTAADDPGDHHDRIDYIFVRAPGASVVAAAVLGEKTPDADIVVTPWPSDHRAVVATISIP